MGRKQGVRGALLAANLPQLQNLIKRDPIGYKEEFLQQWNHYNSIRQIFSINPDSAQADQYKEMIAFLAQVAPCYPAETVDFAPQLSKLLLDSYGSLTPELRRSIVQNLVVMRNKDVITSFDLLKTLFPLLPRTTSASLRSFIRKTILNDIRVANSKSKNHKLNRAVQTMLFGMVERGMDGEVLGNKGKGKETAANSKSGDAASMWAIVLIKQLWKKHVWTDARPVAIVALGCLHPNVKVQSASMHFFLSQEDEDENSDSESDQELDVKSLLHRRGINKKTRSGDKKLKQKVTSAKNKKKRKAVEDITPNFPALELLNDPQTFAEKLYDMLNKHDKRFTLDHKILIMHLLSRIMGAHKLCVLGFYTYIVKYLTYHQLRITSILVALAQSVHDLTPPDVLTPVIRKLASEFVHPGVGPEVIAAGINAIREVCRRQPWCMESDLLGDLIEYRKSRDKGVMVASRGLLQLYREVNPGLLKKRERGKEATMNLNDAKAPLPFGHSKEAAVDIEGLNLLEAHLKKLRAEEGQVSDTGENDDDDEAAWEGWDVELDSSSEASENGWIDVSSDDEADIVVSDSDDDKPKSAPPAEAAVTTTEAEVVAPSTLATTKILTPADFAMLNELRIKEAEAAVQSGAGSATKRKLADLESKKAALEGSVFASGNAFVSEAEILGPRKKAKADYEERMASIQKGREGRDKFGSRKGKKGKEKESSSTNREKARNKPIMMVLASNAVRSKKKASLRQKQQRLRAHIDRAKKSHH